MTRAAALDDLMFDYFALYGAGIGKPLGIVERAGNVPHRPRVTGHPLLILPEVRDIPRSTAKRERMLRNREMFCRWGGRVESQAG